MLYSTVKNNTINNTLILDISSLLEDERFLNIVKQISKFGLGFKVIVETALAAVVKSKNQIQIDALMVDLMFHHLSNISPAAQKFIPTIDDVSYVIYCMITPLTDLMVNVLQYEKVISVELIDNDLFIKIY